VPDRSPERESATRAPRDRGADAPAPAPAGHRLHALQQQVGNAAVTSMLGVQPRLEVGAVHDPAEAEADRIAADVLRRLDGSGDAVTPVAPADGLARRIRRRATPDARSAPVHGLQGGDALPETEAAIAGARGGGTALDPATLGRMEAAFGTDLSDVRIHTGGDADGLAQDLNATAFTTGDHIFFGAGAYQPGTRTGDELLAHEMAHVVQQREGRVQPSVERFVDVKTFQERTYEGRFTQKSTAQKAVEKQLAAYNALGTKNDKGKVVVPDAKLSQALDLLETMRTAARSWIDAHTVEVEDETGTAPPTPGQAPPAPKVKTLVDPKRKNRAAGFAWFLMAVEGEIASMTARRDSDALTGTTQDEVVVDSAGRQKLKDHYTGNLSGALTKAAWLLQKVVPNDGDGTEFSLDVKIPVHEGVFVGGTLDLSAERDGSVEVGVEAAFQAGGTVGVADIAGALGGYLKAGAQTPEKVMKLISYGFYRRCVESNLPAEISSLVWGGGTSDYAKAKADVWSRGVETEVFGAGVEGGDEAYVEMGGLAKVAAEVGIGQVGKLEAEAKGSIGTRYDQTSLQNRKGGAGEKNVKSSSMFTKNVAEKFGRGAEKSLGRTSTDVELSAGLSFLDGALSGTASLEMAIRSQGLHAEQRKGAAGAKSNVKLEELSFGIELAGMLPLGGFATKVAALGLDLASYGRQRYVASMDKAQQKPAVPVAEILLAKQAGEVAFEGMAGLPFTDWAKNAVGLGAKAAAEGGAKAAETALDMGSKVGVELGVTLSKGDGGLEAQVELKHVKAMSVELPSILEIELLRKSRLGVAKYKGGAWSVSA
jgi:hypothetical protein